MASQRSAETFGHKTVLFKNRGRRQCTCLRRPCKKVFRLYIIYRAPGRHDIYPVLDGNLVGAASRHCISVAYASGSDDQTRVSYGAEVLFANQI